MWNLTARDSIQKITLISLTETTEQRSRLKCKYCQHGKDIADCLSCKGVFGTMPSQGTSLLSSHVRVSKRSETLMLGSIWTLSYSCFCPSVLGTNLRSKVPVRPEPNHLKEGAPSCCDQRPVPFQTANKHPTFFSDGTCFSDTQLTKNNVFNKDKT